MSWRFGEVDWTWYPALPPESSTFEMSFDPAAPIAVPSYTMRQSTDADYAVRLALPHVLASVEAVVGRTPLRPRGGYGRPPDVWVQTNRAFAGASGDATPGRAHLDLTLPLDWVGNVLHTGLTSLDSGRHLVVRAFDLVAWNRPGRVLALRAVPNPHANGPPDSEARIFQLAPVSLEWGTADDEHPDYSETPLTTSWTPEPASLDDLYAQQNIVLYP